MQGVVSQMVWDLSLDLGLSLGLKSELPFALAQSYNNT